MTLIGLFLNCLEVALCALTGFIFGLARVNLLLSLIVGSSTVDVKVLVTTIKAAIRSDNSPDLMVDVPLSSLGSALLSSLVSGAGAGANDVRLTSSVMVTNK